MPSAIFDRAHNRAETAAKCIDRFSPKSLAARTAVVAWVDATEIMHQEDIKEAYGVLFGWGKEHAPLSEWIKRFREEAFFRYETRRIAKNGKLGL